MKHLCALLLCCLLLLTASACAESDVFLLHIDEEDDATVISTVSYLRVECGVEDNVPVSLAVYADDGSMIYQRQYSAVSGLFRSAEIYLRLAGRESIYRVELQCGEESHSALVIRKLPRLIDNVAYGAGLPLSAVTGRDTRATVTLLDITALTEAPLTVTLQSSGHYELGSVTFRLQDGMLLVHTDLAPHADAIITASEVQVATNAVEAEALGTLRFTGISGMPDTPIYLFNAPMIAVLVRLTVSFDPATVATSTDLQLPGQMELWVELVDQTDTEAVG